jgi:hypothetical protein
MVCYRRLVLSEAEGRLAGDFASVWLLANLHGGIYLGAP